MRRVEASDEDQAFARAQRLLAENILVVEGRVFARGGPPAYLCAPLDAGARRKRSAPFAGTVFAATPPDRSANFEEDDLRAWTGSFGEMWVRTRLRRGDFFSPDQSELASFQPLLLGLPLGVDQTDQRAGDCTLRCRYDKARRTVPGCAEFPRWNSRRGLLRRQFVQPPATLHGTVEHACEDARRHGSRCLRALVRALRLERFASFMQERRGDIRAHPYFGSLLREVKDALMPLAKFRRPPTTLAPQDEQALDLLV